MTRSEEENIESDRLRIKVYTIETFQRVNDVIKAIKSARELTQGMGTLLLWLMTRTSCWKINLTQQKLFFDLEPKAN